MPSLERVEILVFAGNHGVVGQGVSPYPAAVTAQMVANFAPQQTASFGMGTSIGNAVMPATQTAGTTLNNVMTAAGNQPTVSANTISSAMSPYMNAYVGQALAPQVANLNNQEALQSQLTQGQATSAGAFGDPRATMLQQNQNAANSLQEQGLVGNAYTSAFNTAIGAGAQDVSNNLNAQTTNAGLYNTGLQTQLGAANTALNQGTSATNLVNTLGAQQTAQSQAGLNANYNQYLAAQQYPFLTSQNLSSAISSALPTNTTTTSTAPNNAGYALLGSLIGAVGNAVKVSDRRAKDDIEKIGELNDGLNIYRFRYLWEEPGTTHVGLMAQEVEKKYPEAVGKIGGLNVVDYRKATEAAANEDGLSRAFGLAA